MMPMSVKAYTKITIGKAKAEDIRGARIASNMFGVSQYKILKAVSFFKNIPRPLLL